jgi:hypothetical protein
VMATVAGVHSESVPLGGCRACPRSPNMQPGKRFTHDMQLVGTPSGGKHGAGKGQTWRHVATHGIQVEDVEHT